MELIQLSKENLDFAVGRAAEVLRAGGLIIYPTETAYGLGANALDEGAIRKVFAAKKRPPDKPIHIIIPFFFSQKEETRKETTQSADYEFISSLDNASRYAQITSEGRRLAEAFWPGPLTLIFKKRPIIPDALTAGTDTIGLRVPAHFFTRALSAAVDFPYTTTSANLSGGANPYSIADVLAQLEPESLDLVIDVGQLPGTAPSTLLDMTVNPPRILRQGPVRRREIEEVLGRGVRI